MNFLLAFAIFTGLFWVGTSPITVMPLSDTPTHSFFLPSFSEAEAMGYISHSGIVLSPLTGSIAEKAGIQNGDILISLDEKVFDTSESVVKEIQKGKTINLTLSRSGAIVNIPLTPQGGKVGMYIGYNEFHMNKDFVVKKSFLDGMVVGAKETYYSSVFTLNFLGQTVKNLIAPATLADREEAKTMLSGPIGAGKLFV